MVHTTALKDVSMVPSGKMVIWISCRQSFMADGNLRVLTLLFGRSLGARRPDPTREYGTPPSSPVPSFPCMKLTFHSHRFRKFESEASKQLRRTQLWRNQLDLVARIHEFTYGYGRIMHSGCIWCTSESLNFRAWLWCRQLTYHSTMSLQLSLATTFMFAFWLEVCDLRRHTRCVERFC